MAVHSAMQRVVMLSSDNQFNFLILNFISKNIIFINVKIGMKLLQWSLKQFKRFYQSSYV